MYWVDILNQCLIFAIMAMSLNLLLGYAGQVSVAHAAFAAIGGYAGAYLSVKHGWDPLAGVALGMALALVVGVVISIPALMLSGEYLILLTLAGQTVVIVLISNISVLGGQLGLTGLPTVSVLGKDLLLPDDWIWPLVGLTAVIFVLLTWIGESPFGRVLRGIREDQLATQALGKDVLVRKVVVFGLTSAIAALGGGLFGLYNGTVSPPLYSFSTSILLVAIVVLGGRGNLIGSIVASIVVIGSQGVFEKAIKLDPQSASLVRLICFGLVLVLVMLVRPAGLLPERFGIGGALRRLRRRRAAPDGEQAVTAEALATTIADRAGARARPVGGAAVVVKVLDVHKAFGGIKAVDGLSFELEEGRVTGLIGPNGAGKSTVFNVMTGTALPDSGTVELFGQDITGWPIDRVARHGMVRSFQDVRVFANLSVFENVAMAVPHQRGETLRDLVVAPWRVVQDQRRTRRAAERALAFVGLSEQEATTVSALPFGEQKLVALARILAADAQVILLDEASSGISPEWVDRMVDILRGLAEHGLTICVVEHNLSFVERVADHVYFMEEGRITAAGTMDELTREERLVEVYFGRP
jgi:branched-chain amino acid transport system permease protein